VDVEVGSAVEVVGENLKVLLTLICPGIPLSSITGEDTNPDPEATTKLVGKFLAENKLFSGHHASGSTLTATIDIMRTMVCVEVGCLASLCSR
jgi:hypothetical protein